MKRLAIVVVVNLTVASAFAFADEKQETIRGACMGTKYAVTIVNRPAKLSLETLAEQVSDELERIEQIFSLYRPTSELSRLNAGESGEWISVSSDLLAVSKRAVQLAEETEGAFDPTVGPLVKLWRLRQVNANWSPPTREAITKVRQHVGWRLIEIRPEPPGIRKLTSGVELDLNALVEGWAIDRVTALLIERGMNNGLIELGGEFRGLGSKANGQPWRIAIEDPEDRGLYYATVTLNDAALSTSGNYLQAIEHQGRRYGHILDARIGEPVQHDLFAVSVIASDALTADGWATALLALGPAEGIALAEKKGLAASFVKRSSVAKITLSTAARGRMTREPSH